MIRAAVEGDIPDIVRLGEVFFNEARWPDITSWDAASVTATLRAIVEGKLDGALFVASYEGEIVGIGAFLCFPFYFNFAHKAAQELFWYVIPEHRFGAGRALHEEIEAAAKEKGARVFVMSAMSHLRSKALERLYRMQGYTPRENTFMKRL